MLTSFGPLAAAVAVITACLSAAALLARSTLRRLDRAGYQPDAGAVLQAQRIYVTACALAVTTALAAATWVVLLLSPNLLARVAALAIGATTTLGAVQLTRSRCAAGRDR